eukprot:XP_001690301.1 predicted protein [Chlamydomonas reinhardtii]
MGKPPWLSKTVLAIILLACCPSFARAQDADVAESYEDIVLKIKSASTANETRVRVALVPGRRYSIADSLTSGGLDALVLEGIPSNNPDDLPVLECTDGASVLVSNASTIVLANVRVEGCTGPAVLLQSPIDAGVQRPVNWTLSNVAFAGNLAQGPPVRPTQPRSVAFTASAVMAADLQGSLMISGCTFTANGGAPQADLAHATPPVGVLCTGDDAATCGVSVTDSNFLRNYGSVASGMLLQTMGSATVTLSGVDFTDNTASWTSLRTASIAVRTAVPASAFLHLIQSAGPAIVQIRASDVSFSNSSSSHGMSVLRVDDVNDKATVTAIELTRATFTRQTSGASALLLVGLRQITATGLTVEGSTCSLNGVDGQRFLSAGSCVCIGVEEDEGRTSSVDLTDVAILNNTAENSAALFITTYYQVMPRLAAAATAGRLSVSGLRVEDQTSTVLASAASFSYLSSVTVTGGSIARNLAGGGLLIEGAASEQAADVTVSGVTFTGNTRQLQKDAQGRTQSSLSRGGGLYITNAVTVSLTDVAFFDNVAELSGGAAIFESLASLAVANVTAGNNSVGESTAAEGGDGGAFFISGVSGLTTFGGGTFTRNSAFRNGGALAIQESGQLSLINVTFNSNDAGGSGGAVALQQLSGEDDPSGFLQCNFTSNTARVQLNVKDSETITAPSTGGGGAIAAADVSNGMRLESCVLVGNSATHAAGGAVNIQTSRYLLVSFTAAKRNSAGTNGGAFFISNMASETSSWMPKNSFEQNTAGLATGGNSGLGGMGGAIFAETSTIATTCSSFIGNAAIRGGAIYARLQARIAMLGEQDLSDCTARATLAAVSRATSASAPTLYPPQGFTAAAEPASYGSVFANNTALSGGAVFAQDSTVWVFENPEPKWFTYGRKGVLFANNTASSGGAVLAYSALAVTVRADFYNNSADAAAATQAVAARLGVPASSLAAATEPGAGGALAIIGSEQSSLTLTDSAFVGNSAVDGGGLYLAASEGCSKPDSCYVASVQGVIMERNVALGGGGGGVFWEYPGLLSMTCAAPAELAPPPSPLGDGSGDGSDGGGFLRACDSWSGNAVEGGGYGPDVASTGFDLVSSPHYLDFYTSSAPVQANLSVLDYYGQRMSGGNRSVVIRAVSVQVFGQTYMAADGGLAEFDDLKLRAQAGWHDVDFAAETAYRQLSASGLSLYVRPCTIGEYLSPTLDQCLACSPGYYNFNHTANLCNACDTQAALYLRLPRARQPSPPARVPSLLSPPPSLPGAQVMDCPNGDACTYDNRTQALSDVQQRVMAMALAIQESLVTRPNATSTPTTSPAASGAAVSVLYSNYTAALCAPGYVGVLCGSCDVGYGSTGPATCRLCPSAAANAVYYTLAIMLTMVILAWTIRSLLTQSMIAANRARNTRKWEVMGEMRIMGRPVVDAQLMSVLDDDELPDMEPPAGPIYGRALPANLAGGLAQLRLAYRAGGLHDDGSQHTASGPYNAGGALGGGGGGGASGPFGRGSTAAYQDSGYLSEQAVPIAHAHSALSAAGSAALRLTTAAGEVQELAAVDEEEQLTSSHGSRETQVYAAAPSVGAPSAAALSTGPPSAGAPPGAGAGVASPFYPPVMAAGGGFAGLGALVLENAAAAGVSGTAAGLVAALNVGRSGSGKVVNSIAANPAPKPLQDAAVIKIFISYVQILALTRAVPIPNLPRALLGYMRFYDQITAIPGSLVSLDCSLPDATGVPKAMQRIILAALAPLYVSVIVGLVWVGLMLPVYRQERRAALRAADVPTLRGVALRYLPPRLLMSFATVMFYFYPNTVRALLSIFSCVAAGLHAGKYWTLDYDVRCYVGQHLALAMGLGVTGLLLLATMNRLEETSLVVIMITIYLNLYYISPDISQASRVALEIVIVLLNAVMLAVFVYFITRTSWDKQLDKMGLDRRRVYEMEAGEIQASLRRKYGRRTAALLTRAVTFAQRFRSVQAQLRHTSSTMRQQLAQLPLRALTGSSRGKADSAKSLDPVDGEGKNHKNALEVDGTGTTPRFHASIIVQG